MVCDAHGYSNSDGVSVRMLEEALPRLQTSYYSRSLCTLLLARRTSTEEQQL